MMVARIYVKGDKMNILVTNDDGINAPGLVALSRALRFLGNVYILAPDRNWSASGHVRTMDRPLRIKRVLLSDTSPAWACDGAPSDCVAVAAGNFFDQKMDLVVTGINSGANVGHDVTYSGTVTAAMEAVIWGIPAIAVSLDVQAHNGKVDYEPAAAVALKIANALVQHGIQPNTLLSVNVPMGDLNEIKGFQVTRQGHRLYHDKLEQRIDPRGKPYFWILGDAPTGIAEEGTDIGALAESYVSITPIHLDLTDYQSFSALNNWNWDDAPISILLPEPSIYIPG
jgi:5'-nucleotidase